MAKIDISKIDGYADMTPEQKIAALEAFETEDPDYSGYVKKDIFDKTASELAAKKKELNEKLTEDEQKKQKEQEEREELQSKYDKLLRESEVSKFKAKLLGMGYEEKLADATAEAMADGDTEKVFANQKTCIGIYHMVGSEQNADGSYTSSAMQWCKFKDMENGVIGYFDFINIPNYKNLKGVTDPRKYLENIKADGYATSHKYVDNLMRVIETWHLTDYDKKEETKMNNSPLVVYTKLSPNHSGQRTHSIDRITPHCVVGQLSAESICGCFISTSRQASCNYGIGTDGRISMSVEEKNRSWCSSSRENDQRAVTIECASDKTAPYAFNDAVYASLVNLCVDICQRNGKSKLLWLGDKNKTLAYAPKSDEMVLTVHRWFANKSCPGDWLYNRLGNLAAEVTKRLTGGSTGTGKVDVPSDGKTLYRVQTGAFSKRPNADAWAAKLKAAGFDTYIVQMGNLYKVQVGAYSQKSNAENMMAKLKAAGYDAFITTKSGTAAGTAKKSAAEIAKEIYNGTCSDARWSSWGNGADRVNRLKQAGYDPSEVQSEVNKLF